MRAIKKEGYYYDPPSWEVCPKCGGICVVEGRSLGEYQNTMGVCPRCADSPKPGYVQIRYTPEQWKAAGGILTDDTPVWIQAIDGKWMEGLYWEHDENSHGTPLVIATSAGPPKEEK